MHKSPIRRAFVWFLPTGLEAVAYVAICLLTLVLSNFDFIKNILSVSTDFNLKEAILGSTQDLLEHFFGTQAVADGINYLIWGLVGVFVYMIWWVIRNFSDEISTETSSEFVRPKGTNTKKQVFLSVEKYVFRALMLIFFIVYINVLVTASLPYWTSNYSQLIENFGDFSHIKGALYAFVNQIISLHGFIVVARLTFMRKRLFGSYFDYSGNAIKIEPPPKAS